MGKCMCKLVQCLYVFVILRILTQQIIDEINIEMKMFLKGN